MKYVGCVQIIKDDFNNVLIFKKKTKRSAISRWSLLFQKFRGKENDEKCLTKLAKDTLKTLVFENEYLFDYNLNEEEAVRVYVGSLKERFMLDKAFDDTAWANKNKINQYDFEEMDKNILDKYFE